MLLSAILFFLSPSFGPSWNSRESLMTCSHTTQQNMEVYIQEISRSQLIRVWTTFHLLKGYLRVKGKINQDALHLPIIKSLFCTLNSSPDLKICNYFTIIIFCIWGFCLEVVCVNSHTPLIQLESEDTSVCISPLVRRREANQAFPSEAFLPVHLESILFPNSSNEWPSGHAAEAGQSARLWGWASLQLCLPWGDGVFCLSVYLLKS